MHFEKITLEQWIYDFKFCCQVNNWTYKEEDAIQYYQNIRIPTTATIGSAGHDFYNPLFDIAIEQKPILIPSGIRWVTNSFEGPVVLLAVPRSSLGFKYQMRLVNTIGVIDADYYNSDNEGHIMFKVTAETPFVLSEQERFVQGIVTHYFVFGEQSDNQRTGGFGSTGK